METGTVKWFDPLKGFGFIVPRSGGQDVYVHAKVLQKASITELEADSVVNYKVVSKSGRYFVSDIAIVSQPPVVDRTSSITTQTAAKLADQNLDDDFEREWGLRRA